jgi:hypothetical protein
VDFDPFEVAGECGGRGLDDAEGAVAKFQRSDGDVFDLDALVRDGRGVGLHFLDGAHEPCQQVDGMDGLVHEGAAAVEGPRAAPRAAVVVLLGAVPLDISVAEGELAEASAVDGLLEQLRGIVETRGEDRAELDACFVAGLDDAVAFFQRHFERLLDDHVFAGLGGGNCRIHVSAAGRGDRHGVHRRIGEHLVERLVSAAGVFKAEGLGAARRRVGAGDEFGAADVGERLGVKTTDHAGADDAKSNGHRKLRGLGTRGERRPVMFVRKSRIMQT